MPSGESKRFWNAAKVGCFTLMSIVAFSGAMAQTPPRDTILYGVSYYHEYMPYDRLDQDVQLMKQAESISSASANRPGRVGNRARENSNSSGWMPLSTA